MTNDATGNTTGREEALARALAAAHDTLSAKIELLAAERAAGSLTPAQVAEQARLAQLAYDRDRALAEAEAATGWQTWIGIAGVLYARRPNSSPPKVVRAPSPQALREAIDAAEAGRADGAR